MLVKVRGSGHLLNYFISNIYRWLEHGEPNYDIRRNSLESGDQIAERARQALVRNSGLHKNTEHHNIAGENRQIISKVDHIFYRYYLDGIG